MQCPKCQFENPEGIKFCGECGVRLERLCPSCNSSSPPNFRFCGECGHRLIPAEDIFEQKSETENLPSPSSRKESSSDVTPVGGERKHVTVLFSDLIGYTAMSERLDPEDVKDITTHIFDEISKIVTKYDGFIEKFAGDAVMALFGATEAHEDDPIRAIKAALEIHKLVNSISPQYEERIEQPLEMHTGINTGLVVTGDIDLKRGTHGVAGGAINIAARLSALGNAEDILIGPDTYSQSEGYFDFKELEPTVFKGKSEPIQIFKVLSEKEQPVKVHRLDGFKAELIGRNMEMDQLADAVHLLKKGKFSSISICGAAGTGKSRLVRDFKDSLNLENIQWLEGHAYPYSQNIPYYPLIDLLNRELQIKDGDSLEKVREKVESGVSSLVGEGDNVVPYIGSLFSLDYLEIDNVSPEFWKEQFQIAIQTILSSLAQRAPTIICLEDLHWADPSFLELIRMLLSDYTEPILFLCTSRPLISLFTSHQINSMVHPFQEIRLQDLSPSESQVMVESLLNTKTIPSELQRFIHDKIEGNPFYIEEVINSLIESKTLIRGNGGWVTTRPINELDISPTIHGVISGRLDRLDKETKRILQEASVIGRTFLYEILKKISLMKENIDPCLSGLERLDLVKTKAIHPDLEYFFKHALTQEVVYNGLLKKERKEIHQQIALVMETVFQKRLPEFYETLAFHFKRGRSILKAFEYLIRSGEKSLARYSVEESHQYFMEAFDLLSNKPHRTKDEDALLIGGLIKWSLVYYYRGDFMGLVNLLSAHKDLAESLNDKTILGMFYAWYGYSIYAREKYKDSYDYLRMALEIGDEIDDQRIIGHACAWLSWVCPELAAMDEAILYGERAQKICKNNPTDHYIFVKSLGGIGYAFANKGNGKKAVELGTRILDYGQKHSNVRGMVVGHLSKGMGFLIAGDFPSAIEASKKGLQTAKDPYYSILGKFLLGTAYAQNGQFQEADQTLQEVVTFSRDFGCELIGTLSHGMLGFVSIAKGRMGHGLKMIEEALKVLQENRRRCWYAKIEYALGLVYLQIVDKSAPVSLATMAKNVGFILKNVPSAAKKAIGHFNKAIEVANEIGARDVEGQAYLDLGHLQKLKGRIDQAQDCFSKAIKIFEECEAEIYLRRANKALESLK